MYLTLIITVIDLVKQDINSDFIFIVKVASMIHDSDYI